MIWLHIPCGIGASFREPGSGYFSPAKATSPLPYWGLPKRERKDTGQHNTTQHLSYRFRQSSQIAYCAPTQPPPKGGLEERSEGGGGGGVERGGGVDGWMVRQFRWQLPGTRAKSSDLSQSLPAALLEFGLSRPTEFSGHELLCDRAHDPSAYGGQLWAAQGPLDCRRMLGRSKHPAPWVLMGISEGWGVGVEGGREGSTNVQTPYLGASLAL